MENKKYSPYATNKGGFIKSPKSIAKNEPKATVKKAKDDLRTKRG